jgi:hypothetical protein
VYDDISILCGGRVNLYLIIKKITLLVRPFVHTPEVVINYTGVPPVSQKHVPVRPSGSGERLLDPLQTPIQAQEKQ